MRISDAFLRVAACNLTLLAAGAMEASADPTPGPTQGPMSEFVAQPEADQPADVIGKGYFELAMAGGQERTVRVVVKNIGTEPMTIHAYPVDGLTRAASGVDFDTFAKPVVGTGTWLSLDSSSLELAPDQARRVTATVKVAANATPGDHVAGIALEDTAVHATGAGSRVLIDIHYRRAIAVVVAVPGQRTTALAVDSVSLFQEVPGSRAVIDVRNTGNSLLKGTGTLEIGGSEVSGTAQEFPIDTLIPGTGAGVILVLPSVTLAPGTYNAHVVVRAENGHTLADWQGKSVVMARAQAEATAAVAREVSLAPVAAPPVAETPTGQEAASPAAAPLAGQEAATNSMLLWLVGGLAAVVLVMGVGLGVAIRRKG